MEVDPVNDDDNDDHDDYDNDDKYDYSCNSVNFKVKTSRFCMKLDLDNIQQKMMIMMMMMMMIMIIIAVTQSIFNLGPPDFAWKQIQIFSNIYDDDDDEDDDDDKEEAGDYSHNSVNFQATTS